MKRGFVLLISFLLFFATSPQTVVASRRSDSLGRATQQTMLSFKNKTHNVQFRYPSNWKLDEINLEDPPVTLYPKGLSKNVLLVVRLTPPDNSAHIIFGIDDVSETRQSLASFVDDIERTLTETTTNTGGAYTTLARHAARLGGKKAMAISLKEEYEYSTYFSNRIFSTDGNIIYGFTYAAEKESYSQSLPVFRKILQSFKKP